MEGLIKLAQFILGLSILVSLHEFGHYITAKWFKMKVDKFYLFFDFLFPVPSLLNFALFKKKIGDTEYGLGWFPLGGYVSIAGMIDETQDASTLASEPEPWEFRAKPAWQRLIVMLGGIIVNVILGVLIYWGINYNVGNNFVSKTELNKNGIYAGRVGKDVGFQTGDKVLKVNGHDFKEYSELTSAILDKGLTYSVERKGQVTDIQIPDNFLNKLTEKRGEFISPLTTFKVGQVTGPKAPSFLDKIFGNNKPQETPAFDSGMKDGDKIVSLNGKPVQFFETFAEELALQKGKKINIAVEREGKIDSLKMKVTDEGKIGFAADKLIGLTHEDYTLFQALSVGTTDAFNVIWQNIKGFKRIFAGDVSARKALSGPFEIADMYGSSWNWLNFWTLTGMLSMALAFMNFLPIPALDGGHALFLMYEIITGRPPSIKFQERAQQVGTLILLALMAFVIGNGVFKKFF
jgi:regulator of sigma E protease